MLAHCVCACALEMRGAALRLCVCVGNEGAALRLCVCVGNEGGGCVGNEGGALGAKGMKFDGT